MFLVEGDKILSEVLNSGFKVKEIFSVETDYSGIGSGQFTRISEAELKKISFLQHPKNSVALCEIPKAARLDEPSLQLILDGIQDPGNLGTIVRLADWFGIKQIICSGDTADLYNPKVIQATMGSFTRVNVVYQNIEETIRKSRNISIGTDMDGESIYNCKFPDQLNLILGNEGNGMRGSVEKLLSGKVTIPRFGDYQKTESLNVATATGIILGQIYSSK